MLKKGSVVTLSNEQKYVVVYTTKYKNEEYSYIINKDDDNDSMICKILSDSKIEVVNDQKTLNLFLSLFARELKNNK